ncbi:MAG: APC family permease [Acidimicrobiales bacterium]
MTDGLSADFLGSKQPESGDHQRLRNGQLGPLDITAATMANIGPAMSFYFGFGFLAYTTGLAAPLVIIVAGIAIAFLGNTLAEFTRVLPSTGGFISFIGKTFGGRTAVTTALMTGAGYMAAMASVIAISGGFFQYALQYYNVGGLKDVPWFIWTLVFLTFGAFMMIKGVSISTRIAGFFFAFEMTIMLIVAIVALFKFHSSISFRPFEPKNIHDGLSGLAVAFPLAIYLFIGWENSAALAEETDNPRKNVPRAVFTSIAIMVCAYTLFAFSTIVGFKNNVSAMVAPTVYAPFLNVAHGVIGAFLFFAILAGLTSTLGALIAGTNSQARLVFNAGREGLLPKFIGKVDGKRKTPINALLTFLTISLLIISVWGLGHIFGGSATSGSMSATNFFFESSTFGTILVLLVYALSNLALPFYYKKHHPELFNVFRHVILPTLGICVIAVPIYYLAKPGQATPYDWFPWAALIYVVAAGLYSWYLVGRDPGIGDRVGSIVADE